MIKEIKTAGSVKSAEMIIVKERISAEEISAENYTELLMRIFDSTTVKLILSVLAGYILSGSELGGMHSPLCVPFGAVTGAAGSAAELVGMLIYGIVHNTLNTNLHEIAAVGILTLMKLVTGSRFSVRSAVIFSALTYLSCAGIAVMWTGGSAMGIAAVFFRTCIAAAAAYIFGRALSGGNSSDTVPLMICGIIAVSALCGIELWYFNLGRILVCFIGAAAAMKSGCSAGAAAAAAGVCGMVMADGSLSRSAALIVCTGFVSGLAANRGRITVSIAYIFISLVFAVTVGLPEGITGFIADSAAAGLLLCIVPRGIYMPFVVSTDRHGRNCMRHTMSRLGFASAVMDEISGDISAARRMASAKEKEKCIGDSVRGYVCSKCGNREHCKAAEGTEAFSAAVRFMRRRGLIHENELPAAFIRCIKKSELVRTLNREYMADERRRSSEKTADGICAAALEQIKAQRLAMKNISAEELSADVRMSSAAGDILRSSGIRVRTSAVFYDRDGRVYVEVFAPDISDDAERGSMQDITDRLSSLTGRALDNPVISYGEDGIMRIRWCQLPAFIADVGVRNIPGSDEQSGDTADYFSDGFGNMYFIIADGMGSGRRAAEESCMAVSVIRRFIRSGAGTEAAVHYANLLLSGVFSDEMFTTLDIMVLNTFTGKCTFYKMGAAESYVRNGDEVLKAQCSSLPVGMTEEAVISPVMMQMTAGDSAVMISDGFEEQVREQIGEIMMNDTITAEICADRIISASEKSSFVRDDRTVITVKLYRY